MYAVHSAPHDPDSPAALRRGYPILCRSSPVGNGARRILPKRKASDLTAHKPPQNNSNGTFRSVPLLLSHGYQRQYGSRVAIAVSEQIDGRSRCGTLYSLRLVHASIFLLLFTISSLAICLIQQNFRKFMETRLQIAVSGV